MKKARILFIAVVAAAVGIVAGGIALSSVRAPAVTADVVGVFYTTGMTCGSCVKKIEKALQETGAVAATEVDVDGGRVFASFDSHKVQPQALADKVTAIGYKTSVAAVMTAAQFRSVAGKDLGGAAAKASAASGGCGGGCCNKR